MIDRAHFIGLKTNFLQASQGDLIRKWNSEQLSAIWAMRICLQTAIVHQLFSMTFQPYNDDFKNHVYLRVEFSAVGWWYAVWGTEQIQAMNGRGGMN